MMAAIDVVSLDTMKAELRINTGVTDHDALLIRQIGAAVSFVESAVSFVESKTGATLDAASPEALKQAVILLVRQFYDGYREIRPTEAFYALIAPYRQFVASDDGD